jgi:hypothetical protein
MAIELPPRTPVDESRRGILTISDHGLLALLGIPGNHRIEELRVTTTGNLQIEIVGEDMPVGCLPKPVVLTCHVETIGVAPDRAERRTFAAWQHKPEKRWRLR